MALPLHSGPASQEECPMSLPLCPLCRRVMVPSGKGLWVCRGDANHRLKDVSAESSPRKKERTRRPSEPVWTGITCPLCEVGMERDNGRPSVWACSANPNHEFVNRSTKRKGGKGKGGRPLACVKPPAMGPNPLMDKAAPFWSSLILRYGPVLYPPQSNFDGTMAMPGAVKLGGGSKSGKRKKRKKQAKDRVEQWSDQYK